MPNESHSKGMKELNPWLENGAISRDKVRTYIQSEQSDMTNRLALGEDSHAIVESQQDRLHGYLTDWEDADRMQFHTIYSQEYTKILNESTVAIQASTKKMVDEQNALKAKAYSAVIGAAVALFFIIMIFKR